MEPAAAVRTRRLRRLVAGAIVAAVALLGFRQLHGPGDEAVSEYLTAPVDRGPIDEVVTATGTVNPVKTVQVGTYVSGPIIALDADFNSRVARGQRVAKIDPAPFAVKVRQAEASLANAKARVAKDEADLSLKKVQLARTRTLLAQQLVAQSDFDAARSDYEQAVAQLALDRASVVQAQATLEEAQVNLRYTDILSPVDGVVVARNVDVGQTVAASFQTPTLFLIAEDLTKMQVDTNVSESDVGGVRDGQHASFTVDAYPGTTFEGAVAQVRNAPIAVQNVVTYDVVVAVDNPDLRLKPGMTATVEIVTAHRDDVLRVALRALRFRPEPAAGTATAGPGAGSTVYVLGAKRRLEPVPLTLGARDAQHAEVLGGDLAPGDAVVIGMRRPTADAPVQPPSFMGGRRR